MIDATSITLRLPLFGSLPTYTAHVETRPATHDLATDELRDDDLEQVVGGLARAWSAVDAVPPVAAEDIVVSVSLAHELPQRISA